MIVAGILTALSFVVIMGKLSINTLRKVLGYDGIADVFATIGIMAFFGTTGTVTAPLIIATTGLSFSAILYIAKNVLGYQKFSFKQRKWISYEGKFSSGYFGNKTSEALRAIYSMAKAFAGGIRGSNQSTYGEAKVA